MESESLFTKQERRPIAIPTLYTICLANIQRNKELVILDSWKTRYPNLDIIDYMRWHRLSADPGQMYLLGLKAGWNETIQNIFLWNNYFQKMSAVVSAGEKRVVEEFLEKNSSLFAETMQEYIAMRQIECLENISASKDSFLEDKKEKDDVEQKSNEKKRAEKIEQLAKILCQGINKETKLATILILTINQDKSLLDKLKQYIDYSKIAAKKFSDVIDYCDIYQPELTIENISSDNAPLLINDLWQRYPRHTLNLIYQFSVIFKAIKEKSAGDSAYIMKFYNNLIVWESESHLYSSANPFHITRSYQSNYGYTKNIPKILPLFVNNYIIPNYKDQVPPNQVECIEKRHLLCVLPYTDVNRIFTNYTSSIDYFTRIDIKLFGKVIRVFIEKQKNFEALNLFKKYLKKIDFADGSDKYRNTYTIGKEELRKIMVIIKSGNQHDLGINLIDSFEEEYNKFSNELFNENKAYLRNMKMNFLKMINWLADTTLYDDTKKILDKYKLRPFFPSILYSVIKKRLHYQGSDLMNIIKDYHEGIEPHRMVKIINFCLRYKKLTENVLEIFDIASKSQRYNDYIQIKRNMRCPCFYRCDGCEIKDVLKTIICKHILKHDDYVAIDYIKKYAVIRLNEEGYLHNLTTDDILCGVSLDRQHSTLQELGPFLTKIVFPKSLPKIEKLSVSETQEADDEKAECAVHRLVEKNVMRDVIRVMNVLSPFLRKQNIQDIEVDKLKSPFLSFSLFFDVVKNRKTLFNKRNIIDIAKMLLQKKHFLRAFLLTYYNGHILSRRGIEDLLFQMLNYQKCPAHYPEIISQKYKIGKARKKLKEKRDAMEQRKRDIPLKGTEQKKYTFSPVEQHWSTSHVCPPKNTFFLVKKLPNNSVFASDVYFYPTVSKQKNLIN